MTNDTRAKSRPPLQREMPPASASAAHERTNGLATGDAPEAITRRDAGCDVAVDFLKRMQPEGPWALTAIIPDSKHGPAGRTFDLKSEERLRHWLAQHNDKANLYYHVNEVRGDFQGAKAKRADIERVIYLHVDIDPGPKEALEEAQARILNLLTDGRPGGVPLPTAIVFSGGGYQAFWRLKNPIIIGGDVAKADEVERYNREIEHSLGGDNCHNIDRVMRLPGTMNLPNEGKRKKGRVAALAALVAFNDVAYSLSDFEPAPPEVAARKVGQARPSKVERVKLADLDKWGVTQRVKDIIKNGSLADEPKEKDNSRSAWLFDAVCNLVRCKVPDDIISSIVTDPAFGISESVIEHAEKAETYALKQIARAKQQVERDEETFAGDTNGGIIANNQRNIRVALRTLGARLRHDTFQDHLLIEGIEGVGPLLDDKVVDRLWFLIDESFRFRPSREFFGAFISDLARQVSFHPVCEYLANLEWDGIPRIDNWLATYGGAEDTPYTSAVGRLFLLGAVRRVRLPGCKFDEMPVFESEQGTNKSSALAILAREESWFSDDVPLNADSKRVIESLRGRWIVEAAELKGMKNSEVEHVKALLSRRVDRARLSYERLPTEVPRQCIIVGTTNSQRYLRDGTGNRRFWPVKVLRFDLDKLRADRDQLWAEASQREAAGESTRLDPKLFAAAAVEQDARRLEDPYVLALSAVLGDLTGKVHHEDVWTILELPVGRRTSSENTRLGDAMRELGWERVKLRFGGRNPEHCYARGTRRERERRIFVTKVDSGRARATYENPEETL